MKKVIKPKFESYSDNKLYDNDIDMNFDPSSYYDEKEYDNISKWNIDEKYKNYCEFYSKRMLGKQKYQDIVNEIVRIYELKRKLTLKESNYLLELWRAIEPNYPGYYLNKAKYKLYGKKWWKLSPRGI